MIDIGLFDRIGFDFYDTKTFFNKKWSPIPTFFIEKELERFNAFLTKKNDFESINFEIFNEDIHSFGKSDNEMI